MPQVAAGITLPESEDIDLKDDDDEDQLDELGAGYLLVKTMQWNKAGHSKHMLPMVVYLWLH